MAKEPKYLKIKKDLLQKITSGIFESGDKFYTETEIKSLYNVSSITAIRAVQELANEGYLERYQGKGTFVSRSKKGMIVELTDIEIFAGDEETVEVVGIERMNDPEILKKLRLTKTDTYYRIIRLRKAKGVPYMVQNSYIPSCFILEEHIEDGRYYSIYRRFKKDFGINLYEMHSIETNEICRSVPKDVAHLLELARDEKCVLQIKTTDDKQEVYEYVESYKHCDFYKIRFETVNRT